MVNNSIDYRLDNGGYHVVEMVNNWIHQTNLHNMEQFQELSAVAIGNS